MNSLRDRRCSLATKALANRASSPRRTSLVWPVNALHALLLSAALVAVGAAAVPAQNTSRPTDSPLMRQVQQALALAEHGDKQGAMDLVLHLLEQHPAYSPAIKLKGMLLDEAGRASEAAAAFEEALKFAPNDPDLLLEVGTYKLNSGQKEEALKLLEHCVRLTPRDGEAQYYLAQAYHLNGQNDPALHAVQQSLKAEPENPAVWQKYGELLCSAKSCDKALPWLVKAQAKDPSLPLIDYDIALTDYQLKDLAGAAQYAEKALESKPNDMPALRLSATVETTLAKWQDAKPAFERILAVKPDDVDALLGLGRAELELKDYPAAIDKLQSVAQLDPTRLAAHFYLSRAFAGSGKMAEAQHEAALHHLLTEQVTSGRSGQNDGRKIPTGPGAHTYEGILALEGGDLTAAENDFKAELAADPNYQMAIAEIGEIRYQQGRWTEAAEQLAKSRTMTPELLYMLSDSYFHVGKVSEADVTAETVADLGKSNPELMKQLNDLLLRNGQTELVRHLSGAPDTTSQRGVPSGISLPTALRVRDTPGWWPTKGTAAKEQIVGNAACAKCHAAKAASFEKAAMSHAAVRGEDSEIARRRDPLQFQAGPYHYETQNSAGKPILKISDAKSSVSVPLQWGLGVGHMGQTYVYEQRGNYYESHVSFFAVPQILDLTPGPSSAPPASLETAAGRQMPSEEAQLCFGCHTTASTTKEKFDPAGAVPGVTCESCHGPGLDHIAAASAGFGDSKDSLIFNPGQLDRVDSVDFCGACHRTWQDTVTGGNFGVFNVRFAPYRLENSECWKQGDSRITCLACHDPHKPLVHDTGSYDAACLQCHSATTATVALEKPKSVHAPEVCKVAARNCVTCHMPKYEPTGMHSTFTDHWIRVVRAGERYPE